MFSLRSAPRDVASVISKALAVGAGHSWHTNLFCAASSSQDGPAVDIIMTDMRSPDLPAGDVAVGPDAAIPHRLTAHNALVHTPSHILLPSLTKRERKVDEEIERAWRHQASALAPVHA